MRVWALLLLAVLAACASTAAKEGEPDPERWRNGIELTGIEEASRSRLLLSAARELKSFANRGRRPADAADAAYSMELYLRDEGFAHADVEFELRESVLVFRIDEGPRAVIGKVEFVHEDPISDEELAEFFAFAGRGLMGAGRVYFREGQVRGAVANLEKHYLSLGYYEVEIGEPEVTWSEDKTQADVRVHIRAGRLFTVASIEVAGIDPADFDAVGELTVLGQPYYVALPAKISARVRGKLYEAGHQFCDVSPVVEIDHEAGAARIRINVEPGPKVRLRDVEFKGLDRTYEKFVRNRIPLETDDVLEQELLDAGYDELYRAAIFGAVRPQIVPVDGMPDYADLLIELQELQARSVGLEVGWGSYERLRGAIRIQERNFLGLGRRLTIELKGSTVGYEIEGRFADPWILGRRDVLEIGALTGFREEPSFDRTAAGFDVQVRHKFPKRWRLRVGYEYADQKATNITGSIDPNIQEQLSTRAGIFTVLRRDMRDDPLIPMRGWVGEAGLLWSSDTLGATLNFLGFTFGGTHFFALSPNDVIGINGSLRTRMITDGTPTLPIQERLFLGGPSTVRSFKQDELGPTNAGNQPTGGLTSLVGNLEYRRRIWGELHGAVFYDIGLVDPQAWTFKFTPGHGVGAGLRYYLPIGPIRFDAAYNPAELFASTQRWVFHLAVGFSF